MKRKPWTTLYVAVDNHNKKMKAIPYWRTVSTTARGAWDDLIRFQGFKPLGVSRTEAIKCRLEDGWRVVRIQVRQG